MSRTKTPDAPAPAKSEAREHFEEKGGQKMSRALDAIARIGTLANNRNEFTVADIHKMGEAILAESQKMQKRFTDVIDGAAPKETFNFDAGPEAEKGGSE
jgi:hypothetical protein